MANKECTVFIVDVGQSTGEKRHGRDISDFDWLMQYVWDKLATIIQTNRKTLFTSILGLRTDDTEHEGPEETEYENLTVFKYPSQLLMPDVRRLTEELKPTHTDSGDAISAIIVAIGIITKHCKQLKYKKQIILTTNCTGSVDAGGLTDIGGKLKEEGIELLVLGADLDDPEYGFKEEDKDETKQRNEETLKELCNLCDGTFGTLKQATDELQIPRIHIPNSMATFRGKLTLGDSETYGTAMEIDVERYPKIMPKAAQSAKKITVKTGEPPDSIGALIDLPDGEPKEETDDPLVRQVRTYSIKDDNAPGGRRDVEGDDLAKGYEYGREIVAMDPADEAANKLETVAGMSIIGFVPRDNIARYMDMSKTCVVIAQKSNDLAAMALSSLIHTLYELDTCAIARLVTKDMRPPVIVALTSNIEPDFECLIDVELPFAEDVRQHRFPPLDRINTISGKVITEHRNLPTEELQDAMDAYIDSMDISTADRDEEGDPTDYLKFEDSFSPKPNRITQVIKHRAIHPDAPAPPPTEILTRFSHPRQKSLAAAAQPLTRLATAANVKKVPPKSLARRAGHPKKDHETPRSGLDVASLLAARPANRSRTISPGNAIPEFKQIVDASADIDECRDAIAQFGDIIKGWVRDSIGDSGYGRAVEGLRTLRAECVELEEAGTYNDFLRGLKTAVFKEELGGDRREFWWSVRQNRVGLVVGRETEKGGVVEEEARRFLVPDRTRD